jgi:hypothetical protein
MVHLMTAYKYNPNLSAEFWVGNIAPDSIVDWKERDKFHLRNEHDRQMALIEFAKSIDKDDWFSEGILLHLFVDWKWDEDMRQQFIHNYGTDDWFLPYRSEIGLLSARLYHYHGWSKKVWEDMIRYDIFKLIKDDVFRAENIIDFLYSANRYHIQNSLAQPFFYSIETIDEFTTKMAKDYDSWRNSIL